MGKKLTLEQRELKAARELLDAERQRALASHKHVARLQNALARMHRALEDAGYVRDAARTINVDLHALHAFEPAVVDDCLEELRCRVMKLINDNARLDRNYDQLTQRAAILGRALDSMRASARAAQLTADVAIDAAPFVIEKRAIEAQMTIEAPRHRT